MIALDTSGLVKRYLEEDHSDWLERMMSEDGLWFGSMLLAAESPVVVARSVSSTDELAAIDRQLTIDLDRFHFAPVDADCLVGAVDLGRAFGLRTLDAIHLAAVRRAPAECRFVTFDSRQRHVAEALGIGVLTPD